MRDSASRACANPPPTVFNHPPTPTATAAPPAEGAEKVSGPWLVLCDRLGVGERLSERLEHAIRVQPGESFRRV